MNLEEASMERDRIRNNLEYWEGRKEKLMTLILPKSFSTGERVDGGEFKDKFVDYVSEKEIIDSKIVYYKEKLNDLTEFIEKELERYGEHNGTLEKQIFFLKTCELIEDKRTGRKRHLTWEEISERSHFSITHARRIYNRMKKEKI